jgi:hypothetical protein
LFPHPGNPLCDDNAALGQQPADLVDQRGSLFDEPTAQPVDRLDILTLYRLERHEAHMGTGHRFTGRLGVATVVLVPFGIGLHKQGTDEFDHVPKLLKLPCPILRTPTRRQPNEARRKLRDSFP